MNLMEGKVDYRTLLKMKNHIFDRYPADHEITREEWKKESGRFMHIHTNKVEEELLEDICVGGKIDRHKVIELLDIYQFCPVKIKKDKNKSEDVYFVLNSNKRGAAQNREEILAQLKEDNDKKHLSKIMTLIAIKIEEKFHSLAKAFLFFDIDGDQTISRTEFHKGIEGLRVKLSK